MKKTVILSMLIAFVMNLSTPIYAAIPIYRCQESSVVILEDHDKKEKKKKRSQSRNGILAMSFGIATFIIFPIFAIPAVIFGIISLTKNEPKKAFAISGLIIGGLTTLAAIAVTGLLIAGIF